MHTDKSDWQLRYDYEVLNATLKIREFFLKTVVRDVYENVGQVLSLVRMHLAMAKADGKNAAVENIAVSELLGQSVKDLRSMCSSFYPDVHIVKELEWIDWLECTISTLELQVKRKISITGKSKEIPGDLKLIIFRMLQEILISLKNTGCKMVSMHVQYLTGRLILAVQYAGIPNSAQTTQTFNETNEDIYRSLYERAMLLNGTFQLKTTKRGISRIELKISTTTNNNANNH